MENGREGEANGGGDEQEANGEVEGGEVNGGDEEVEDNGGNEDREANTGYEKGQAIEKEVSFDGVSKVGVAYGELLFLWWRVAACFEGFEAVEEVIASLFIFCRCCNCFQIDWHIASS